MAVARRSCAWLLALAIWAELSAVNAAIALRRGRKSAAPFDLNPTTWMADVKKIDTDLLILFYSPTCPDCEKLMPEWAQIVAAMEDRDDLTLLTVADPEGIAPGNYKHYEIPSIFFAPRKDKVHPHEFPQPQMHLFIDVDKTKATRSAIRSMITNFALSSLSAGGEAKFSAVSTALPISPEQENLMNAKFLVALKARSGAQVAEQLDFARSSAFGNLPVAKALGGLAAAQVQEPLATIAARLLDAEPTARHEAAHYAQWYMKMTGQDRQQGSKAKLAETEREVLPTYLRNTYLSTSGQTQPR